MSLPDGLATAMAAALGADGVISEPEQLKTYECDGLTGYRVLPALVALPRTTAEVQAAVRLCHEQRVPFVARGAGTGLSGGAVPVADGVVISLARMNRDRGDRPRQRPCDGRARRDESRRQPGGRRSRLLLRPGSFEPAGLHDRRQRGRELGRRPLPQARVHGHPRDGPRGRASRRRARLPRRQGARPARSRPHGCSSSAPRARSASPRGSRFASCAARRPCGRCWPAFDDDERCGRGGIGGDRSRDPGRRHGDHGPPHARGSRGGRASRLSRRRGDPARRARRQRGPGRGRRRPRRGDLPRVRRRRAPRRNDGRGAGALLEGPQGRVCRDGPRQP